MSLLLSIYCSGEARLGAFMHSSGCGPIEDPFYLKNAAFAKKLCCIQYRSDELIKCLTKSSVRHLQASEMQKCSSFSRPLFHVLDVTYIKLRRTTYNWTQTLGAYCKGTEMV